MDNVSDTGRLLTSRKKWLKNESNVSTINFACKAPSETKQRQLKSSNKAGGGDSCSCLAAAACLQPCTSARRWQSFLRTLCCVALCLLQSLLVMRTAASRPASSMARSILRSNFNLVRQWADPKLRPSTNKHPTQNDPRLHHVRRL